MKKVGCKYCKNENKNPHDIDGGDIVLGGWSYYIWGNRVALAGGSPSYCPNCGRYLHEQTN